MIDEGGGAHRRRRRRSRRRRTGAKGNYGYSSTGRMPFAAGRVLERRRLTGPAAMMRVAQLEGAGAAIEGGAGRGGERSGGSRSGSGPPVPEASAGRPPAAAASRSGRTRMMLLQ